VRFARCCEPLPGDRIVGFITRGRGVSVHYADCPQVLQCDPLRKVDVMWDGEIKAQRKVRLTVHSQDQIGLLANMSRAITENGANIASASIKTTALGKAMNSFELTIEDARQLERIKRALEMVPGVIKVERVAQINASESEEAEEAAAAAEELEE
jgi:GTP pyrophosphokinase